MRHSNDTSSRVKASSRYEAMIDTKESMTESGIKQSMTCAERRIGRCGYIGSEGGHELRLLALRKSIEGNARVAGCKRDR